MSNNVIVVSNNVVLTEGETSYLLTTGYLTNTTSNTFLSTPNSYNFSLTLAAGNATTSFVTNTYLQNILGLINNGIITDLVDLDNGSF